MTVRELRAATWEEVRDLVDGAAGGAVVAILPVGATEAHGPHLPLATDVVIAEAMARAGAERLSRGGHTVLVLPPLAYTAAPFAAGFAGTISVRAETVHALVLDIARSLARQGIDVLALANAHLDPTHVEGLRSVVEDAAKEGLAVALVDLTRRRHAERLTDEFRTGACHAGRFEGSIVLAERDDWVRRDVQAKLPPVPISLSDAIREGRRTFEEAGGDRAYFGWPADATAEEGRRSIDVLGTILEEVLLEAIGARGRPS